MDDTAKELREIRIEMNTMSLNLTNFMKTHESQMDEVRSRQKDHHENIYGTANSAGLRMEQDRQGEALKSIKAQEKIKSGILGTLGVGVIMLVISSLWKLLTGK